MARMIPPPSGTILVGKYRVERTIGSGGMGVVVEATHLALDQRVALKLLDEELAGSGEILARFLREARIAARLPSEHVARVTDVGQTEAGLPYIVMELMIGHDFEAELARRGPLPLAEAVDLILEACEGVAVAHAAGLVHRDLKPANLFLAQRPNRKPIVKVLDFGLSKEAPSGQLMSLTGGDAVFGTPQYMSPEQIKSTKNVDARSDQHALGMILFEMLTGRTPYPAENVAQLIVTIATHAPLRALALRPDLPPGLDAVIARAIEKRPEDRFADLGDLADALAPYASPASFETVKQVRAAFGRHEPRPVEIAPIPRGDFALPAQRGRPAHSLTELTSSVDPLKRVQRNQRVALFVVLAAVVLGGGLLAGLALALRAGPATVAQGEVAALDDTAASASAAVSAAPTASAAIAVEPVDSASPAASSGVAASASAPSSAGSAKKGRLPVNKALPSKPAMSSAIGVFGDRKK